MDTNKNLLEKQEIFTDDALLSMKRAQELEDLFIEPLPDGFHLVNDKLMYQEPVEEGKDPKPGIFVCSRLDIVALTRDAEGNNQGRLLEFIDADDVKKRWAMPMELLAGDGTQYRAELLSMGLRIGTAKSAKALLAMYIQSSLPKARAICVRTTGWHNKCFVLPDEIIGESGRERLILQSLIPIANTYTLKGSLEEWKQNISSLCCGNSRLILAICTAFAAPLLHLLEIENGGFHFKGPSSCGKTTAVKVGCSVWGGPDYMQRWRATINGLEALAAIHNDTLLCLDELGQIDPFEAGEAAYLLAHGTGKTRANQLGLSKKKSAWRLLFLSTGETGLAQHMLEAGKKVRAGQEVRIVEIAADTGKHGIFECLHNFEEAKAFAEALDESCKKFYGTAGRQFILSLLQAYDPTIAAIKAFRHEFIKQYHPKQADGQVGRVLNRFALIAAAGEIATSFGITGWQQGEAIEASLSCFNAWLQTRGGIGSQEERVILSQVRRYFEQHGESRFSLWEGSPEQKTVNRAGFRRYMQGGIEFYVFAEAFRMEICEGLDPTQVAKVCARHGLLMLSSEESCTRSERLPGMEHTVRCYRFTSKVLGEN